MSRKPKTEYADRIARGRTRPICITLDAAWLARLDKLVKIAAVSRSELVRRAIETLERVEAAAKADRREARSTK